MRKTDRDDDNENLDRWLLTYADLITLLLALFIVMYSISRIDTKKFGKVSKAFNTALSGTNGTLKNAEAILQKDHLDKLVKIDKLLNIQTQIRGFVASQGMEKDIDVILEKNDLTVHVTESAFFESGKADIKLKAKKFLRSLSSVLKQIPNEIRVEGHTDNIPISTPQFPSNWELSVMRATKVVRFLTERCGIKPKRISALGFGEYKPRFPNDTPGNRRRNRRVDIVILRE